MARARFILAALSGVAVLAGAVPLAQAGGGQGSGLPTGTTTCRVIHHGGNPRHVLNVVDLLTGTEGQNVRVDPPVLLCDIPASAEVVRGPALTDVLAPNFVTCYRIHGSHHHQGEAEVTLTDPFGTRTVQVDRLKFLCVPALVEE